MAITVKFFASIKEQFGKGQERIEATGLNTVLDVWLSVGGETQPENVLMAVNMEYVEADAPVKDGDEVAFFPPVTGG